MADVGTHTQAQRRRELIDATFALVAEKGLEGLRTRDIAARVGVNISTLHYYFATKESLLVALVEHVREIFTSAGAVSPADADLDTYFRTTWQSFQDNPHLGTVLQELTLRAGRDPMIDAALQDIQDYWTRLAEAMLRREVAEGRLAAGIDPRLGALVITSFTMGATTRMRMRPDAFDFMATARELTRWLTEAGGR